MITPTTAKDVTVMANMFAAHLIDNVLGCGLDRISSHAMLVDDLGADSLDILEIQSLLEEKGVAAPDEVFSNVMRVGDIGKLIAAGKCAICDGAGEKIVNTGWIQDPINETSVLCHGCDGVGRIHQALRA